MAESEEYESVLCVKPEVHVYRVPPRASNRGYRAAEWQLDQPAWSGRMRITAKGNVAYIKLEDKNSGELFAQAPVDQFPSIAVEGVTDSSRYFVIRIEDGNGRRAFIGVGFVDRGDAFDFNVALQDHFKWVKQQSELAKQAQNPDQGPKLDLGFKEGQTIKLNIANVKKKDGSSGSRPRAAGSGGPSLIPPPPGGKASFSPLPGEQLLSCPAESVANIAQAVPICQQMPPDHGRLSPQAPPQKLLPTSGETSPKLPGLSLARVSRAPVGSSSKPSVHLVLLLLDGQGGLLWRFQCGPKRPGGRRSLSHSQGALRNPCSGHVRFGHLGEGKGGQGYPNLPSPFQRSALGWVWVWFFTLLRISKRELLSALKLELITLDAWRGKRSGPPSLRCRSCCISKEGSLLPSGLLPPCTPPPVPWKRKDRIPVVVDFVCVCVCVISRRCTCLAFLICTAQPVGVGVFVYIRAWEKHRAGGRRAAASRPLPSREACHGVGAPVSGIQLDPSSCSPWQEWALSVAHGAPPPSSSWLG